MRRASLAAAAARFASTAAAPAAAVLAFSVFAADGETLFGSLKIVPGRGGLGLEIKGRLLCACKILLVLRECSRPILFIAGVTDVLIVPCLRESTGFRKAMFFCGFGVYAERERKPARSACARSAVLMRDSAFVPLAAEERDMLRAEEGVNVVEFPSFPFLRWQRQRTRVPGTRPGYSTG